MWQQHIGWRRCFAKVRREEVRRGVEYSWVVKLRPDFQAWRQMFTKAAPSEPAWAHEWGQELDKIVKQMVPLASLPGPVVQFSS